jgi:hypothetical protein
MVVGCFCVVVTWCLACTSVVDESWKKRRTAILSVLAKLVSRDARGTPSPPGGILGNYILNSLAALSH